MMLADCTALDAVANGCTALGAVTDVALAVVALAGGAAQAAAIGEVLAEVALTGCTAQAAAVVDGLMSVELTAGRSVFAGTSDRRSGGAGGCRDGRWLVACESEAMLLTAMFMSVLVCVGLLCRPEMMRRIAQMRIAVL